MIPYGRQFLDDDDVNEIIKVLKSDFITQGPRINQFEECLASYFEAKYAVVFNSGTSALHGAYFALGLKKDDEFITTPITFVATSNAGLYLGAKPVFVDVEKDTANIDCNKILENISKKTKLIVPVHLSGHPVDLERIFQIARENNLFVVEDACHAVGAKYNKDKIGNCQISDMAVFSFHPVKHITTGEGGAVLTNNPEFYEKLKMFSTHGITKDNLKNFTDGDWYYEMHYLGYNYRMTDIQAALGISQLKKLNSFIQKRREIVAEYEKAFSSNPYFDIPIERAYAFSSYHLYIIRLKDKLIDRKVQIFRDMRENGIGVQVHYIPVYWQPYYQKLGYGEGLCPNGEDFYRRAISIPIYPAMGKNDLSYVIETILKIFKKYE